MNLLFYVILAVVALILIRQIFYPSSPKGEPKVTFKPKKLKQAGREIWVQVYDTDSLDEVQSLQARLEEEELQCLIYEQGRKDVHGNELKGFGIAVPKTSVPRAQKIIVQMPS
jgi:hypothetical protein